MTPRVAGLSTGGGAVAPPSSSAASTSSWIAPFVAMAPEPSGDQGPPRASVIRPPASTTISPPAAMSQGPSFSSQKPSKRPAAT